MRDVARRVYWGGLLCLLAAAALALYLLRTPAREAAHAPRTSSSVEDAPARAGIVPAAADERRRDPLEAQPALATEPAPEPAGESSAGGVRGRAVDALGRAVPQVTVQALREGEARPTWSGTTDAGGRFTLVGLTPGRYELELTSATHAPAETHLEWSGQELVLADVVLSAGAVVQGRVTDVGGAGIAAATLVHVLGFVGLDGG